MTLPWNLNLIKLIIYPKKMRASQVPKVNRWLIESDARSSERELFKKLSERPLGKVGFAAKQFHVQIPGAPFNLLQPIILGIPGCAQVYLGPSYERLSKGDEPIQLLAAGFKDNELSPVYFSLLRAQDVREGSAALILLPFTSHHASSVIYMGLMRHPRYMQRPHYHPDWKGTFRKGSYPIRTQEVRELEQRLAQ